MKKPVIYYTTDTHELAPMPGMTSEDVREYERMYESEADGISPLAFVTLILSLCVVIVFSMFFF